MSKSSSPETKMAAALGNRGFSAEKRPTSTSQVINFPGVAAGSLHIGTAETGQQIGIDIAKLLDGRVLIQGASGAGKSWTLRRVLEQTWGRVQQVVIDPEGEYRHFANKYELLHLEGHKLDIATLSIAGTRAREHRVSVVLDLSELDRDDQMKAATAFITALIAAPREHWHPVLVAIDEAHLFAPYGGFTDATHVRKASIAALTDLMSRGRKRGLAGVLATQRLARLAKSVVSEAQNFMVGLNTLDLDIRRAAETIGWDARKGFDRLPLLTPGDFVAVGPAFSYGPVVLKVGPVETVHVGAAPALHAPAMLTAGDGARVLNLDELLEASASDQVLLEDRAPAGLRHIRQFIREPAFVDAAMVWRALVKLIPQGANIEDLRKHLKRSKDEIAAAIALLDQYGVVEFSGDGAKRAVRVEKGMAACLP